MKKQSVLIVAARLVFVFAMALGETFAQPDADSFVRVSPRDARYLELSNGHPCVPIGLNMVHPEACDAGENRSHRSNNVAP